MGSVTYSESIQLQNLYKVEVDLIGFIDGSHKQMLGLIKAGIGGVLHNINKDAIFTFSGHFTADSPSDVEWGALCFLLNNFVKSKWANKSLIIYVDCKPLVVRFLELYSGKNDGEHAELTNQVISRKISIKLIPRELNNVADSLAKKGGQKAELASLWAYP